MPSRSQGPAKWTPTIYRGCTGQLQEILSLPMWAGCIAFVNTGTGPRQFIAAWARISRNVKAGVIVSPIDEAIFEYRIRSRDTLRQRHRIANFSRTLRQRDVNG